MFSSLPPQSAALTQGMGVSDGVIGGTQLKTSSVTQEEFNPLLPGSELSTGTNIVISAERVYRPLGELRVVARSNGLGSKGLSVGSSSESVWGSQLTLEGWQ